MTHQLRISYAIMMINEATSHSVVPEEINWINHQIITGINNTTQGQIFVPYKQEILPPMNPQDYLDFSDYRMFVGVYKDVFGDKVTNANQILWQWMLLNNKILYIMFDKETLRSKLSSIVKRREEKGIDNSATYSEVVCEIVYENFRSYNDSINAMFESIQDFNSKI